MKNLFIAFLALLNCHLLAQPHANPLRMEERIKKLGTFGANPEGGVSRVAFSDADLQGRAYVISLMKNAGLEVSIDAAGNIIGKRKGKNNDLPVIAFGSHIDSVPNGGNYDGDVGSVGAIECIELLNEGKIQTNHPLEVIIFEDEEGGLTGSEAIAGILASNKLDHLSHSGKTIRQGIQLLGGDPEKLASAAPKKGSLHAFLELHIEQGGILFREGTQIGVVEGIVGINQWKVTAEGKANHAGTTPMNQRQDALLASSRLVVSINEAATSIQGRQVATVGKIMAWPGAPNVIPGKTEFMLEIRDLSHDRIMEVFSKVRSRAEEISKASGVSFRFDLLNENFPALTDKNVQQTIAAAAKELNYSNKFMPSGAGHDTQDMARIAPTGMIFIPSKDGISHSPYEYSTAEDMARGVDVLLHSILKLDLSGK